MSSPSARPRSPAVDFVFSMAVVATACVAAASLLAWLSPPIDTLGQFASPALSVAVAAAVLALFFGRFQPALLLAAIAAVLALELAPQWFARPPPPAPGARPVRIYFNNLYRKNDGRDVRRSIETADPDVVGLVEVSPLNGTVVRQALAAYPYRLESEDEHPWLGRSLVASRYPLRRLPGEPYLASTTVFAVEVEAPQPFHLLVIHTPRPWPYRSQEWVLFRIRKRLVEEANAPVVLIGDFNATLSSAALQRFRRQAGLSALPAVLGDWPAFAPAPLRLGIENALAGPGMTLFDRRLGPSSGSDHRPLVFKAAPAARAPR